MKFGCDNLRSIYRVSAVCVATVAALTGCSESLSNSSPFNSTVQAKRYLYVASGACYGGGVTLSTGSATIAKYDIDNGTFAGRVVDYNQFALGDQPAGIQFLDSSRLLIAIENTGGRRVDIVNSDGTNLNTYVANSTALNGILRAIAIAADGSILVAKSTAIEKFSTSRARVTQGANPYINAPAGTCATATTQMVSTIILPNGKIAFGHAAATPNNKIGIINSTGYSVAADCNGGLAAPTTTALPTAMAYHSTAGKLIVAYGSTTSASNFIYTYDVNLTTGAITNPIAAYTDFGVVFGPSAMTVDSVTGLVYVANGANTYNNVEAMQLNSNGTLTKVGTTPFLQTEIYTRCISGMRVGN